jgi:putative cell wall-binding protein
LEEGGSELKLSLKKFLVLTLIVALAVPVWAGAAEAPVTRLSGGDRYATAVAISKEGWSYSGAVVIARGDSYADALAGVPLAYSLGAPILLTAPKALPAVTRQEIVRLGAARAIILGGAGAVSNDVADALRGMGLEVERIAGSDRFDTAARIAARVAPNGISTAVIASGRNFPDALAVAPYAAAAGYPVLLVEPASVPTAVEHALKGLGVSETIVVGGTGVIGSSVLNKLPRPRRISGADRYATAVALARHFSPQGDRYFIATGRDFADAITGGVLAAREGTGLLLVGSTVPSTVSKYLQEREAKSVCILGGTGAVSATIANALKNILAPPGTAGLAGWTVPGASVTVAGRTTVAAADGSYLVTGLSAGKHTAVFSREGYGTKTYVVNIAAERCSVLNADLVGMDPGKISLRGAVVDKATDLPLEEAEVAAEILSASGAWVLATKVKTDSNGVYYFTNSGGEDTFKFGSKVRLTIRKDADADFRNGYHPVVLNLELKKDSVANLAPGAEMVRVKPMNLSGRGTEPDGTAVGGKSVTLYYGDRFIAADTNAQGDYLFQDLTLPTGKYTILMDYAGNEQAMYCRDISVSEGRDLRHDIKLQRGYQVRVETKAEKDGELFREGAVYNAALLQGGAVLAAESAAVIDNGKILAFSWSRIAPGSYTVRISGDYVLTKTFSIQVYSSDYSSVNQRVTRAGAIKGTVKKDGGALNGAKVELVNTSGQTVAAVITGSDGRYCFGGLAGSSKYTLRASGAGYRTEVSGQLVVAVNEDRVHDFALPVMLPTGSVSGTVRAAGTLIPAAGAKIDFRALSVPGYSQGAKVKDTNVLANGTYLADLNPGAYTVVISAPGKYETLEAVLTVAAGDVVTDRNFRLQPGGNARLTVTVRDSANRAVSPISLTDKWGDTVTETTSNGTAVFKNLSAGAYLLKAKATGHEELAETIEVPKGTAVSRSYTLTASAKVRTVEFWVVGENNTSVQDARILVLAGTEKVAEGKTLSTGKLQLRLPAGTYKAMIYGDRYFLETVEFKVGSKDVVVPVIRLEKW